MADTTIIDDQFVEDLQTELENLNQDTVMDSGVQDGFLDASLLNPASPSFEAVLPYIFEEKGDPAKIPEGKNRLIELIKTRFTQKESIKLVVSGGPGKQSQFWVPFPQVWKPVSVKIGEQCLKASRGFRMESPDRLR